VQYASATGTSWQKTDLTGVIQPGQYYLIQQAKGSAGTTALPTPDVSGTLSLSGTAGKVALVITTTALTGTCPTSGVIDLVGFGTTANCFEGTAPTPAPSNTTAVIRADNGCTDINDNAKDFVAATPTPRNSNTAPKPCSTGLSISVDDVAITEGDTETTNATFTVSLSEVATTAVTFDIATQDITATASSDYTAASTTGATIAAGSTSYTFTVVVTGDTQAERDETFAVTLANISGAAPGKVTATGTITNDDGIAITPIYSIQGSGMESPLKGQTLTTAGIVVGDYQSTTQLNGFFIQDASGDNNPATSDGIFVYTPGTTVDVLVGQLVQVTGTVEEFSGLTQINKVTNITPQGNGTVSTLAIALPVASNAVLEQYEGMLVTFSQKLTVSQNFTLARYGEVWLSADLDYPFDEVDGRLFNPTNYLDPTDTPATGVENDENNKAAITNQQNLHNLASILLDDASSVQNPATAPYLGGADNSLRVGSSLNTLTGILSEGFSYYRLQPTEVPSFTYVPRPVAPPAVGAANLKIASFNVLNYFNGDGNGGGFPTSRGANNPTEFSRQRAKIIAAINGLNADVIGLLEMENDGDGVNSAIADLVRGLNEATNPGTYDYIRDPANGGTGTDEIKVAFIYKSGSVMPVGSAIADTKPINNRPTLAQTFRVTATNEIVSAVINHFKSKGGTGTGADADQNDGQSAFNATRIAQANALVSFVNEKVIPAAQDNDVILLGDFNAYNEEDPIDVLRAAGFKNLFGPESYSYVFDGQSGSLDHALATPSLAKQFTAGGKWHINADEPIFLDYNTEFKTASQIANFYEPTPYRSSDHDPVLVGLRLSTPTISFAQATTTVNEGAGTQTINLTLSEPTLQEATVTVSITNGAGATYGSDYTTTPDGTANSFTVTIPAGSTAASFSVNLMDDQLDEIDEEVVFAIAQVSSALKLGSQATSELTISDNDVPAISFQQTNATINAGSGEYIITLNASIAPVSAQTVTISINDYDLQYGIKSDYVTNPNGATGTFTLTIPAGQTTATFTVTTNKSIASKKNSLKQIDFTVSNVSDGAAIGTPQTFVLNIGNKKEISSYQVSTYPNPATSNIAIKVENAGIGETTLSLFDQVGNAVLTEKVQATTENLNTSLEVGQLRRGDYYLIMYTPNGMTRNHIILN